MEPATHVEAESQPQPIEPHTEEWYEARRTGIGGSDAAKLCGVSPWGSPFSLYQRKRGAIKDDGPASMQAIWGNLLEEPVRRRYEKVTGRPVHKGVVLQRHPEHTYLLANTDGLIPAGAVDNRRTDGVYEGKTTAPWNAGDWSDGPPLGYVVQVQHYLLVQELEWAGMCCFVGTARDVIVYDVERDDRFLRRYQVIAKEFWERVENGDPPPVDRSGATRRALDALYPKAIKKACVRLDWEYLHLADSLLEMRSEMSTLKKKKDGAETLLRGALKQAQYGLLPDGRALSRTNALRVVKRLPKGIEPNG